MLKRRGKAKKGSDEIPVSSFSDIAFLLIIFFILVTSLTKSMGFTTEMPASKKSEQKQEKTATVKINNERIYFNDSEVSIENMAKQLLALELPKKKNEDDRIVMLELNGRVGYQKFYAAMSAISHAGGTVAIVREEQ